MVCLTIKKSSWFGPKIKFEISPELLGRPEVIKMLQRELNLEPLYSSGNVNHYRANSFSSCHVSAWIMSRIVFFVSVLPDLTGFVDFQTFLAFFTNKTGESEYCCSKIENWLWDILFEVITLSIQIVWKFSCDVKYEEIMVMYATKHASSVMSLILILHE